VKYWVYKDSRILGPFDKNSVAGLPGLDASTLVCAGESAAAGEGDWRPAGDVSDLAALPLDRGAAWPIDDMSSTYGLLDKLQLETAGLIGDDEFPGAAEELFQDPGMKQAFGDLLAPRPSADEAELRRAKDRATELTVQLELLYKRVAELEAGQTSLVHRLAEKELQLRSRFAAAPPPDASPDIAPAPAALSAAPPSIAPATPPPVSPTPASPAAPSDWQSPAGAGAFPSFPSFGAPASAPIPVPPAPTLFAPPAARPAATPPPAPPDAPPAAPPVAPPAVPPSPSKPAPLDWAGPPLPASSMAPAAPPATAADVPPEAAAPIEPAAKKAPFEKKTFKTVPTVKSFRVVGPEEKVGAAAFPATDAPPPAPAPAMPSFAAAPTPAPISLEPLAPPPPPPPPTLTAPPMPEFEALTQAAPLPTPIPAPAPESPPTPSPSIMPPATLSFGAPSAAEPAAEMPSFSGAFGGDMSGAPSPEAALARLAKPAPAPVTAAPRPPRSNKPFLIGVAVLVLVMAAVGALFLRHPKDLKQMTELDDGRSRLGAEPTDDAARPPLIKPKMAAPPAEPGSAPSSPAPAPTATPAVETAQAASQAKLDAAVAAVKDFPLDGERGTVAQWLQFSYSASPDAGKEAWSASETADKTYLVEYRFTPSARGDEVHYLFEVDMDRGFVIGKNLDAKSVLAGGPRVSAEKAKPRKTRKPARSKKAPRAARRAAEGMTPQEVPLLPLPNEGELRPPAEDDGAFNSDTVNSGL
jgi:hypothetical protein